jgi:hypothetical protein
VAKKIYDIKPPKAAQKVARTVAVKKPRVVKRPKAPVVDKIVKQAVNSSIYTAEPTPSIARQTVEKKSTKKPIFIGVLIIILVLAVYLFFKLPKADVTIWPKLDVLSFQQTIIADKTITSIDATKALIPALYFESEKIIAQDFPATGNASNEGKASGTITIYNKYDPPKSFTFVTGTHFMSDSGKLFIASEKIVIPAAKKVGSKITPGSVDVKIQAVEGGTDYNIAPSNFSIPGLKGTASYYSIYASSTSDMTGGYVGKVKKVTEDDIQQAKNVLSQKATTDATTELKAKISADYVLLDNAILSNVSDASTQTKAGAVADTFNYIVTVKASALAFKKADVEKFVKDYILSQVPENKKLLDGSTKIDYSSNIVDISGGKATLNLSFSSSVYQNIDNNAMGLSLIGETVDQAKQTIYNSLGDQVSKVQIKFWPFWVGSVPNSQKAINIFLKFQ